MNLLVTGGCGFIGSNFVRRMLDLYPAYTIVNLDSLTYAGNLRNLEDLQSHPRYHFEKASICDRQAVTALMKRFRIDAVVNFAAETHVDRSISGASVFVDTNVGGTNTLLSVAVECKVERYVQISTDEVYGSLGATGAFSETTPLHPNSPYAASKASADLLVSAYHHTFGLPALITRCSNNYGPFQFPEKLIPLMIINAMSDKPLPVYGDGLQVRDWLHVSDHCAAIDLVLHGGHVGEVYNIGGNNEWKNIDIVRSILTHVRKPESLIAYVKDRPGHDRRYAIDASKIAAELGWKPAVAFDEGLRSTIEWYERNEPWWRQIISGEYQDYYRKMYAER
jgi:dTDP-glucose 4,6-dehydratase